MILRPPRNEYKPLMPKFTVPLDDKIYLVHSFFLYNDYGDKISCTFVEPGYEKDRTYHKMPCVVYGHNNDGNKIDGL